MPGAVQNPAVLRRRCDAHEFVRRDEVYAVSFVDALVEGIAVVRAVADHAFGGFGKESLVKRGFDELSFMRRSAGHVHGESQTMAVCHCHDFAAFATFSMTHTSAPFLAPVKT